MMSGKISLQAFFWTLVCLILLATGVGIVYWMRQSPFYAVSAVEVHGDLQQFSPEQLKEIVLPHVSGNFFKVNLDQIQSTLQQEPGLGVVKVRRIWPNRLRIDLYNQEVIALWNRDKLLNVYGETFPIPAHFSPGVFPHFFGVEAQAIVMIDVYGQLNKILRPLSLTVSQLYLQKNRSWSVVLSNGMELKLGQKHILTRLKQFVKVYNKVFVRPTEFASHVDLRYRQGMAIQWAKKS